MTIFIKRLEYKCKCINISTVFSGGSILWPNGPSEFEVIDDMATQVGHFRTWADDIDPDSLRKARDKIKGKVDSFVLAMQFRGNARFSLVDETLSYTAASGEEYKITDDKDIEAIIHRLKGEDYNYVSIELPTITFSGSGFTSPIPLPQSMPLVPLKLKRHILNVIQAEELEDYKDEQLKRWFLIIEELEKHIKNQKYKDIKSARDFVSHPKVNTSGVIAFLKRKLPSSVYSKSGGIKHEACFQRDDPLHIAVVAEYEALARQRAKTLIENEILKNGGYLWP